MITSRHTQQTRPRRRPSGAREVLLVANARASGMGGRRSLARRARDLLSAGGTRVDVGLTREAGELEGLVRDGHRRVVLLGGDGTLHAFARLPAPRPEVALLPAGRANNVAASLGIPTDLVRAAALAVGGSARPIDLISARAGGRRHLAVEGVSVGLLALARERYRAPNSADRRAAARAGLGAVAGFRPFELEVVSDGHPARVPVTQLFVANLPRYAFGLRVAPGAQPDDGLLDLVAFGPMGRLAALAAIPALRHGAHLERAGVSAWRARRVTLDPGGRSPVIADSTSLGRGPVELTAVRAALAIVAPSPAERAVRT